MKKFLVIYNMPSSAMAEMMQNSTPEEMEKGKQEWREWMDAHKAHLADEGNPVGKNTRITKEGATEVSNDIGGYSIFQGESKEAVVALLKTGPHIDMPGSYVEVMEIVNMM